MWSIVLCVILAFEVQSGASQLPVTNEGLNFALALPPARDGNGDGELILLAKEATTVVVNYPYLISDQIQVSANTTTRVRLPYSTYRCTTGIEHKGIFLTSDKPFTAHLGNYLYSGYYHPETTTLRPITSEIDMMEDEVYIVTYSGAYSTYIPNAFYMVVSLLIDTEVWVYQKQGNSHVLSQHFTLGWNEVFTEDAGSTGDDFTGYYVRASKPVAVYAGHGQASLTSSYRHIFESMAYKHELGTSFVTTPYYFGSDSTGYRIRILSVTNATSIFVPAIAYEGIHNAGDFYQFDFINSRHGTPVFCSEPCIAVQYALYASSGGPGSDWMMPCMLILNSREHYSTYALFSTPSYGSSSGTDKLALSILVDFYPVDDLYLDGTNQEDLDWAAAAGSTGWFATTDLSTSTHRMWTTQQGHGFVAYVHSIYTTSSSSYRLSYAYAASYGGAFGDEIGPTAAPAEPTM